MTFQIKKFWQTLKVALFFIKVRTFGTYIVTWNGVNQPPLNMYTYKGKAYFIVTELFYEDGFL